MGIALKVYKDNALALTRRIDCFTNGEFDRLLTECREIQRSLKPKKSDESFQNHCQIDRKFFV